MTTWFVDGGAHRGESVRLARRLHYDVAAVAVEPASECWQDLVAEGALVVPAALWSSAGHTTFYRGDYEVSATLVLEKRTGGVSAARAERVPTVTLGSVLRPLPAGDRVVVKLDVEGAEYEVLEHALAEGALDRVRAEDLYVDFHGDRIDGFPAERHARLVGRLLARGYFLPKWDPVAGEVLPWGRRWLRT